MKPSVGKRVQLHPATDHWMRGQRYGEVTKVTKRHAHVLLDGMVRTSTVFRFDDILEEID